MTGGGTVSVDTSPLLLETEQGENVIAAEVHQTHNSTTVPAVASISSSVVDRSPVSLGTRHLARHLSDETRTTTSAGLVRDNLGMGIGQERRRGRRRGRLGSLDADPRRLAVVAPTVSGTSSPVDAVEMTASVRDAGSHEHAHSLPKTRIVGSAVHQRQLAID